MVVNPFSNFSAAKTCLKQPVMGQSINDLRAGGCFMQVILLFFLQVHVHWGTAFGLLKQYQYLTVITLTGQKYMNMYKNANSFSWGKILTVLTRTYKFIFLVIYMKI